MTKVLVTTMALKKRKKTAKKRMLNQSNYFVIVDSQQVREMPIMNHNQYDLLHIQLLPNINCLDSNLHQTIREIFTQDL